MHSLQATKPLLSSPYRDTSIFPSTPHCALSHRSFLRTLSSCFASRLQTRSSLFPPRLAMRYSGFTTTKSRKDPSTNNAMRVLARFFLLYKCGIVRCGLSFFRSGGSLGERYFVVYSVWSFEDVFGCVWRHGKCVVVGCGCGECVEVVVSVGGRKGGLVW